jgi:xylulokinase
VLRAVIAQSGIDTTRIAGLGLTGQMHSSVFLDADGAVIRPALLWNDQRTAAECAEITERVGETRLSDIVGNPALTGFQAPKILWLRNHEPEQYARVRRVLLPKDYIRYLLSGAVATDASDAAGTLLLDLHTRDWSDEILERLQLPRDWFPQVYEGPEITGHLQPDVAAMLGLPVGLPIIAGGGDNAAAAVGTGVIREGMLSSSLGTSGVLFAHSDSLIFDPRGRLHTFCHAVPGKYHLMGVTLAAGGSFRWLRDLLGISATSSQPTEIAGSTPAVRSQLQVPGFNELTAEAAQVPPGAEGLLFLPYLSGERTPHMDPLARGGFIGLTLRHKRAHLVRAVMEGVVYSLRDSLEIMRELGMVTSQIRATGGGGRSPLWRQMQADIYGTEVAVLAVEEGPAYGAALLAGVGTGIFASIEAACDIAVTIRTHTLPDATRQSCYNAYYQRYCGLYATLRDTMHMLNVLAQ